MDVLMPQLGEDRSPRARSPNGSSRPGEQVKPGDNLFEIETDKVSMEVPSTTTGVLAEIRVPAGDVAPVGAIVAVIADGSTAQPNRPTAPAATPATKPAAPAPVAAATSVAQAPLDTRPIKLDPFFEVRTPDRNYGPARLSGGITITPLARRLAARIRDRSFTPQRLRPPRPHRRARRRNCAAAGARTAYCACGRTERR